MPESKIIPIQNKESNTSTNLTPVKNWLIDRVAHFGIFNIEEKEEWIAWVNNSKDKDELNEFGEVLSNIISTKFDFKNISKSFLDENLIKDVNLVDFLRVQLEGEKQTELTNEELSKDQVLVLIGEQYFQNWPGITFPIQDETGVFKRIFVLPYPDCQLGVLVFLDEADSLKTHRKFTFAKSAFPESSPLKHGEVIPSAEVCASIIPIVDLDGLDKRKLYFITVRSLIAADVLFDNSDSLSNFNFQNLYQKIPAYDIFPKKYEFLACFCDDDKLEFGIQNFITLATLFKKLDYFKVINQYFGFYSNSLGEKLIDYKIESIHNLSRVFVPKDQQVEITKSKLQIEGKNTTQITKEEVEEKIRERIKHHMVFNSKSRLEMLTKTSELSLEKLEFTNSFLDSATRDYYECPKTDENKLKSIKDKNLLSYLQYRVKLNLNGVYDEKIDINEDVLILRGAKYFQNWPMMTFVDEDEIKGYNKVVAIPNHTLWVGVVVDLTKKDESGNFANHNFVVLPNLNKHKTIVSKDSIHSDIYTLGYYEGLDEQQLHSRAIRDLAVVDRLFEVGKLKESEYVTNKTLITYYLDLFLTGKRTSEGAPVLQMSLQNFLLVVTLGRKLSFFEQVEKVFDFEKDDRGNSYLICDPIKILDLSWPIDLKETKSAENSQKSENLDYSLKTLLLIKPKEFFDSLNPISKIDKKILSEYDTIIFSDGNLPGKVAVNHVIDSKCRTFGFGYLDYKFEAEPNQTEIDLTGKINKDNFRVASYSNLDLSYLFFILEAFVLERKLISFGENTIYDTQSDFKDVQTFVMAMLDTAHFTDDCKTELDGYVNFLISHLDFTLNDFLNSCTFEKISQCWLQDKTIYEWGLSKLSNRRVVEMTMAQEDQSSKDLAQILSRKILTIDEMPEKTKIGIMGRLKKLISTDGNAENNQKQKDAVDQILAIPYGKYSKDNSIDEVIKYLDENLYGMEFTKKQVLQFLAKHKLNSKASPKTLCLVGNPGVGKTYFCQQFSKALNRPFFKIGIGGLNDSAILNGSNPVYVGSDSGYIAKSLIQNQVMNPVVILDEIDKIGSTAGTSRNAIQSAFLEILDPMQNAAVRDNFLQIELDLSQIWFVATANDVNAINPALVDRMEVIEIQDYSLDDKIHIFDKIVWPRNQLESGLIEYEIIWDPLAKEEFISSIKEPGIRSLDKKISSLCGSLALDIVSNKIDLNKLILDVEYISNWEKDWESHISKTKIGFELD